MYTLPFHACNVTGAVYITPPRFVTPACLPSIREENMRWSAHLTLGGVSIFTSIVCLPFPVSEALVRHVQGMRQKIDLVDRRDEGVRLVDDVQQA